MAETDQDTRTDSERIDSLETKVDSHDGKLDEILGIIKGKPKDQELDDQVSGRPASISEQVRAEFAKRDADSKRQADDDAGKADMASVKEQLAKLQEQPPPRPQTRRERMMWGKAR